MPPEGEKLPDPNGEGGNTGAQAGYPALIRKYEDLEDTLVMMEHQKQVLQQQNFETKEQRQQLLLMRTC